MGHIVERKRKMAEIQIQAKAVPAQIHTTILGQLGIKYRDRILKEMNRELGIQERMFKKTVSTWRHDVAFTKEISDRGSVIEGSISTDDRIYRFLNDGTSKRYATMSKDFEPKSHHRTIGSSSGSNPDPVYISRKNPRPGIEKREWVDEIFQRREKYFTRNFAQISLRFWKLEFHRAIGGLSKV